MVSWHTPPDITLRLCADLFDRAEHDERANAALEGVTRLPPLFATCSRPLAGRSRDSGPL